MLRFSLGSLRCLGQFELDCEQRQSIDRHRFTLSAKVLRSGNFFQFPDSPVNDWSLAGDCGISSASSAEQPASRRGSSG
jgi:hypothetical protein